MAAYAQPPALFLQSLALEGGQVVGKYDFANVEYLSDGVDFPMEPRRYAGIVDAHALG